MNHARVAELADLPAGRQARVRFEITIKTARVAELADALDLGSSGQP